MGPMMPQKRQQGMTQTTPGSQPGGQPPKRGGRPPSGPPPMAVPPPALPPQAPMPQAPAGQMASPMPAPNRMSYAGAKGGGGMDIMALLQQILGQSNG